jgi:hypothetical protein
MTNTENNKSGMMGGTTTIVGFGDVEPAPKIASGTDRIDLLESEYDRNSKWAYRLAPLIIVGLLVEIAAVFILERPLLEGALTIVASALIVIGVWGELWFDHRAKKAGDGIVAEANARAAEANARAAEAQLELERLRKQLGPRTIQRQVFLEALKDQPKEPVEILVAVKDDAESNDLARQIFRLLMFEKWDVESLRAVRPDEGIAPGHGPSALSVGGQPTGVAIVANSIPPEHASTAFNALRRAFLKTLGTISFAAEEAVPLGKLRIVVSPKQHLEMRQAAQVLVP